MDRWDVISCILEGQLETDVQAALAQMVTAEDLLGHGHASLHWASVHGNTDVVAYLVLQEGQQVDARDRQGATPLHEAASEGHLPVVLVLLEGGANPLAKDRRGKSPRQRALLRGHAEVALLLQRHEALSREGPSGEQPPPHPLQVEDALLMACALGELEMVSTLVESHGAHVRGPRWMHWRSDAWNLAEDLQPIHVAAMNGHVQLVAYLLEQGAPVWSVTIWGKTPTHVAAIHGQAEVISLLMVAGADLHSKDALHQQPVHHAARRGHVAAVEALLAPQELSQQQQREHKQPLEPLVEAREGFAQRTPLHMAARQGHLPLVLLLLARGASPLAKDLEGKTPSQLARGGGHTQVARLLRRQEIRIRIAKCTLL